MDIPIISSMCPTPHTVHLTSNLPVVVVRSRSDVTINESLVLAISRLESDVEAAKFATSGLQKEITGQVLELRRELRSGAALNGGGAGVLGIRGTLWVFGLVAGARVRGSASGLVTRSVAVAGRGRLGDLAVRVKLDAVLGESARDGTELTATTSSQSDDESLAVVITKKVLKVLVRDLASSNNALGLSLVGSHRDGLGGDARLEAHIREADAAGKLAASIEFQLAIGGEVTSEVPDVAVVGAVVEVEAERLAPVVTQDLLEVGVVDRVNEIVEALDGTNNVLLHLEEVVGSIAGLHVVSDAPSANSLHEVVGKGASGSGISGQKDGQCTHRQLHGG